jgi:hypothetical protein
MGEDSGVEERPAFAELSTVAMLESGFIELDVVPGASRITARAAMRVVSAHPLALDRKGRDRALRHIGNFARRFRRLRGSGSGSGNRSARLGRASLHRCARTARLRSARNNALNKLDELVFRFIASLLLLASVLQLIMEEGDSLGDSILVFLGVTVSLKSGEDVSDHGRVNAAAAQADAGDPLQKAMNGALLRAVIITLRDHVTSIIIAAVLVATILALVMVALADTIELAALLATAARATARVFAAMTVITALWAITVNLLALTLAAMVFALIGRRRARSAAMAVVTTTLGSANHRRSGRSRGTLEGVDLEARIFEDLQRGRNVLRTKRVSQELALLIKGDLLETEVEAVK